MTASLDAPAIGTLLAIPALLMLLIARRAATSAASIGTAIEQALASRYAPFACGALSALCLLAAWGSLHEPGVIHDERAYLLQAEIFASGRWTAAPPPLPAFFEQMHVFVAPAVFAKYPPVHSLLLAVGMLVGFPGLVPVLLTGLAGGLTFWLARRFAGTGVALLTWLLWSTAPMQLAWSASYMSETTSTALWLIGLVGLVRWIDTGGGAYLSLIAACLALGVSARPLTMAALGVPVASVILFRVARRAQWRQLAFPILVGSTLLCLGPLWNAKTAGHWRADPYPLYSRTYFPHDKPGFGIDATPPLRALPAEFAQMDAWSRDVHRDYQPAAVPGSLARRAMAVAVRFADGWRILLLVFLLVSLRHPTGPAIFGLASTAMMLLAYLLFAHPPEWVVYYVEILPALHFIAAAELGRALTSRRDPQRSPRPERWTALVPLTACLAVLPFCLFDVARVNGRLDGRNRFHRAAQRVLDAAPEHSIVFVRYPSWHSPHLAVTRNEPDLAAARSWIVYDRPTQNAQLLGLADGRVPLLFDTKRMRLVPMNEALDSARR